MQEIFMVLRFRKSLICVIEPLSRVASNSSMAALTNLKPDQTSNSPRQKKECESWIALIQGGPIYRVSHDTGHLENLAKSQIL